MAKYKYGDRVKYNGKNCKVGVINKDVNGDYIYSVVFDDGTRTVIPESQVNPASNINLANVGPAAGTCRTIKLNQPIKYISINIKLSDLKESCPVCKNTYQTMPHPIHGAKIMWSDCLTCNKTKEQIESEKHTIKTLSKEIEDDCDDFGFYD